MATFCQTLSHYTERSLWSTSNWHYHKCVVHNQCDHIGRFFALWATIQSWWPQLFWPNCPFLAIFVRVSKSFIFLVKLFLGNFLDIWQFFTGYTVHNSPDEFGFDLTSRILRSESGQRWCSALHNSTTVDSLVVDQAHVLKASECLSCWPTSR